VQLPLPSLAENSVTTVSSNRSSMDLGSVHSKDMIGGVDPLWVKQIKTVAGKDETDIVEEEAGSCISPSDNLKTPESGPISSSSSMYSLDMNMKSSSVSMSAKPKVEDDNQGWFFCRKL